MYILNQNNLNYCFEDTKLNLFESDINTLEVDTENGIIIIPSSLSTEEKVIMANKGFFIYVLSHERVNLTEDTINGLADMYANNYFHFIDFNESVCRFFGLDI